MTRHTQRGFTLIELMIVVAIIAIISSIAFNAFSDSGRDSRRVRGLADIQALNDAIGRYYQTNFSYTGATLANLTTSANLSMNTEYTYTVTVNADGQSYRITAAPSSTGSQTGDGAMMMDNAGRRCFYPENDAPDFSTCPHSF